MAKELTCSPYAREVSSRLERLHRADARGACDALTLRRVGAAGKRSATTVAGPVTRKTRLTASRDRCTSIGAWIIEGEADVLSARHGPTNVRDTSGIEWFWFAHPASCRMC